MVNVLFVPKWYQQVRKANFYSGWCLLFGTRLVSIMNVKNPRRPIGQMVTFCLNNFLEITKIVTKIFFKTTFKTLTMLDNID